MSEVDVLELAELTRPAPRPRWTGRRTGLVFAALGLIAALVAVVSIVMAPPPPADRLMLGALPEPAWSVRLSDDESVVALGTDLVVIRDRRLGERGASLRGIASETGEPLWVHTVRGRPGPLQVRDLPGTVWVAVQIDSEVTLLDRLTGDVAYRFHLPAGDWGKSWFGSSDKGTFLMAVPGYGAAGRVVSFSRLAAPDPAAVVWTREIPLAPPVDLALRDPEVIERSGMLLVRSADTRRMPVRFAAALRASDGNLPGWLEGDAFVLAGGAAVFSRDEKIEGFDLMTGRRLWRLEPATANLYASGDVLIVQAMGEVRRVDPYSGRTQWVAPMDGIYSRLLERGDQLIVYQGAQTIFPDRGTTMADSTARWVGALDLATGRNLWRTTTPSPVLDVMLGTDHLVTRMFDPGDEHPAFEVAALEGNGDIAWVWRDVSNSWALTRLGRHLATIGPDGTLTVWG